MILEAFAENPVLVTTLSEKVTERVIPPSLTGDSNNTEKMMISYQRR